MTPRPAPKLFGIGSILPLALLLVALSSITLATLSSFGIVPSFLGKQAHLLPPTAEELGAVLARVGITPEALTAAGVDQTDTQKVITDAQHYLDATRFGQLKAADEDWKTAQETVNSLESLIRSGHGTKNDLTALRNAQTALQNAVGQRDRILDSFQDAAVEHLNQSHQQLLHTIHTDNHASAKVLYRVKPRTQAQWTKLRDALANIKTSAICSENPNSQCVQLVTQVEAEPEVAAAKNYMNTRLSQITSTFNTTIGYDK